MINLRLKFNVINVYKKSFVGIKKKQFVPTANSCDNIIYYQIYISKNIKFEPF